MIEINLLPPELRKKRFKLPEVPLLPIGVGVLGILVMVNFAVGLMVHRRDSQLKKLTLEWQEKLPLKQQADVLKEEAGRLRKKKAAIEGLSERRFLWSKNLNLLSDLIPMGVWLTDISLDEREGERFLTLEGVAMSFKDQEMIALVTRFMETLKGDEDFSSSFDDVELGPIKRVKAEEVEVMKFTLICRLRKGLE